MASQKSALKLAELVLAPNAPAAHSDTLTATTLASTATRGDPAKQDYLVVDGDSHVVLAAGVTVSKHRSLRILLLPHPQPYLCLYSHDTHRPLKLQDNHKPGGRGAAASESSQGRHQSTGTRRPGARRTDLQWTRVCGRGKKAASLEQTCRQVCKQSVVPGPRLDEGAIPTQPARGARKQKGVGVERRMSIDH